jgi:tetratricopeptide (TPR) repeat protein
MKAIRSTILALCLTTGTAFAAGDPSAPAVPPMPKDPVMEKIAAATRVQDWPAAQAILKDALARNPQNPDYHNLYAYTVRKGPNPDMSLVFQHYNQALAIDPNHKQAHEYLGEAYLMVGNVAKAKEHLAQLDKICFLPCSEYSQLKTAIADYEKKTASR